MKLILMVWTELTLESAPNLKSEGRRFSLPTWSAPQDKTLISDVEGGVDLSLMSLCQPQLDNLVQLWQLWNAVRLPGVAQELEQ